MIPTQWFEYAAKRIVAASQRKTFVATIGEFGKRFLSSRQSHKYFLSHVNYCAGAWKSGIHGTARQFREQFEADTNDNACSSTKATWELTHQLTS
ncbi:MAG: hypothetical protein R3C59_04555 [Planctomycetaceae bacterium]